MLEAASGKSDKAILWILKQITTPFWVILDRLLEILVFIYRK